MSLKNIELDDAIFGSGSVDFGTGEFGLTELQVFKWDISRGVQLFAPELATRLGGIIDGRVEIYGPLDNPYASINFYASRGHFNDQTDFWAVFSADYVEKSLNIKEFNIGRGVLSLLTVSGAGAADGSDINFNIASNGVDVSQVVRLAGFETNLFGGLLTLDASVKGSAANPEISVSARINSGYFYKAPFEKLEAEVFIDSSTSGVPVIERLLLTQSDDLVIRGEGSIPINSTPAKFSITLEGNVLKIPNLIERTILKSSGEGRIFLEMTSGADGLRLENAEFVIHNGYMKLPDVVKEIEGIEADIHLEGNRVVINDLSGTVDRQKFRFDNFFIEDSDSASFDHLYFRSVDLDVGILTIETEGRGLYAHIPALMIPGSMGYFRFNGKEDAENFLFAGPVDNITIQGKLNISRTILTFPFPEGQRSPSPFARGVLKVLKAADWDIDVIPERDNRYVRQISSDVRTLFLEGMSDLFTTIDINLNINAALSHLKLLGNIDRGNFRSQGTLVSTRGTIEYLDLKFNVDQFTADFDEHDPLPWVEGRGQTVYIDSLGQTRNIYLKLYVVDPVTGERTLRGRWGDFIFILEDDAGSSQEQILASMGYSPEQITDKMTALSSQMISDAVLRRWIRPIERELESVLNVDFIRLQPAIAKHFFETQVFGITTGPEGELDWGAYFLNQSQLSVGKYITDDIFVTYTGLWESALDAQNERHSGVIHRWRVEYRILPISKRLTLDFGYEYDSLEQLRDREIKLRYSILF